MTRERSPRRAPPTPSFLPIASVILLASSVGVSAQDAAGGRTRAQACVPCHGPLGISAQPNAPHLAGQPAIYLIEQLKAYRSGRRQHEVMSLMAKPLKDEDIADLAAWFASIEISARPPR